MANAILTSDLILKEGVRQFVNNTPIVKAINPQYDKSYEIAGGKSGDQIRIKRPQRYSVREGMTMDTQVYDERKVDFVWSQVYGIDLEFTQKELGMDIAQFSKEVIQPAIGPLTSKVEYLISQAVAENAGNVITLPVTNIDREDIINAGVLLSENGASAMTSQRHLILDPKSQGQFLNQNASVFNPSAEISRQYTSGVMGDAYGFQCAMSQNIHSITRGTANTAYTVDGAVSSGTSIVVADGTGTLKKGNFFNVAGVYNVNPLTKNSTGRLKDFTVAADYAGGAGTITITEAIVTSGAYQNVSIALPNDAAITVYSASGAVHGYNMAFTSDAIAFGCAKMEAPKGAAEYSSLTAPNGLTFSLTSDYDIRNHKTLWRFDILCGVKVVIPEHIVIIPSV
jgi:hypothetical protein